jgi:hypothetical protein
MLQLNNIADVENEVLQFKNAVNVKSEELKISMCLVLFTDSHMKVLNIRVSAEHTEY